MAELCDMPPVQVVDLTVSHQEARKLKRAFRTHSVSEAVLKLAWLWLVPEGALMQSADLLGEGGRILVVLPVKEVQRMKSKYGHEEAADAVKAAIRFVLNGVRLGEALCRKARARS